MNVQQIHLEIQCSNPNCKGLNYFEDETGYYVCADCNTISQIRCGLELDYTFPIRSIKSKNIKNEDDDIISDDGNENNDLDFFSRKLSQEGGDTFLNMSTTNIKSSLFESSINDFSSIYSRSFIKKMRQIKNPKEKLIEIQGNFENIINILLNENNTEIIKMINFGENDKKSFYEIARRLWICFLAKKYKNIESPQYKRKKIIRSRNNSIDEENERKKNKDNENEKKEIKNNLTNIKTKILGKKIKKKKLLKPKEIKLHEQLKMRRITERNIYSIYNENKLFSDFSFHSKNKYRQKRNNYDKNNFYTESNFNPINSKKDIIKRFIAEYDQVINFIKKDKCFDIIFETEEEKEKINITNTIEFEQLNRVCEELGINTKNENNILINQEELNFEELIHLIYKQQINYNNKYTDDNCQLTNGINSNHFLFLIYQIFHYNKIPLLLNDILFNYNNFFYIKNLSLPEINFLFLLNFKKFKAHINWFDNRLDSNGLFKKADSIINKICNYILKMPDIFTFLCKYILKILHNNEIIKSIISKKYIIEYVCIGIILYCLKIIYGLNDLPYMCLLLNNINKKYINYDDDIDLNEEIKLYKINTKNDELCQIYSKFPTELDIIGILIDELKKRENNSILINNKQRKVNYSNIYKKIYIDINSNSLYKNFYDDFTRDINELENVYNKNKKESKNKKGKKWKIKKSNEFDQKVENIENSKKIFNQFIKEEINFHESVYKNKDTNVEFPLPVDTYIKMKKHSNKMLINYHRPTEMIFIYLFCQFFKIDYLSLRTIIRLIESSIERIYNK